MGKNKRKKGREMIKRWKRVKKEEELSVERRKRRIEGREKGEIYKEKEEDKMEERKKGERSRTVPTGSSRN